MQTEEPSKVETIKRESRGLRGTLAEELASDAPRLSPTGETLIKFHGMYEQKDRDRRPPEERHLGPKPFTLMVRGRIPGGRLSPVQWLAWDEVSERYSSDGLRITTRQSLQLHGVLKSNAKAVVRAIATALSSTTGACGDVVRNVAQAVNPSGSPRLAQLDPFVDLLSRHFEARSRAYAEIFLDGAPQHETPAAEGDDEPLYGRVYLPRKFKVAVTEAGDNSVDVLTQDLAFAATFDGEGRIDGWHVYVGGGMGMTHGDAATYPRLADTLGWIPQAAILAVAEAVVTAQRDFGDRAERSHARLKYTIEDRGLDWFRSEVERRAGVRFTPRAQPAWRVPSHLGWIERHDGTLALGYHVLSGRLRGPLKAAIRELVARYRLDVQLTAEQDLILLGIAPSARTEINAFLAERGLDPASPSPLHDRALTCVALPMCSKALAEAERIGAALFGQLEASLAGHGLSARAPTVRITGCPNGCARPYAAELGLVGQMPQRYALYVGGSPSGTRLGFRLLEKVPYADIPGTVDRLFGLWASEGAAGELFGDFVQRVSRERLLDAARGPAPERAPAVPRPQAVEGAVL